MALSSKVKMPHIITFYLSYRVIIYLLYSLIFNSLSIKYSLKIN